MAFCALLSCWGGVAGAAIFQFDLDDFVQRVPDSPGLADVQGQNQSTQPDARRLTYNDYDVAAQTYFANNGQLQPRSYNTFLNWRDGLGSGEGVSFISCYFPRVSMPFLLEWGQNTVWNGLKPVVTVAPGWNAVVDVLPGSDGWYAAMYTENPSLYINKNSVTPPFTISGNVYRDANGNGYDPSDTPLAPGADLRIEFWAYNYTFAGGRSWEVFFDDKGWGTRTPSTPPFSAGLVSETGPGNHVEGVLNLQTIPEPAAIPFIAALGISRLLWNGSNGEKRPRRMTAASGRKGWGVHGGEVRYGRKRI